MIINGRVPTIPPSAGCRRPRVSPRKFAEKMKAIVSSSNSGGMKISGRRASRAGSSVSSRMPVMMVTFIHCCS
jgi:hypothetical protein